MRPQTVIDVFYAAVERNYDRVMTFKQTVRWIAIASHELYRDAVGTARTLESWGMGKGDRVAIISENRPEWAVADFGTLLLGGVVVPVYPTLPAEQTAYILNDSEARVVFVSTAEQLKKVLSIQRETKLEKVVVMDYVGITEGIPMHRMMHNQPPGRDAAFDARARATQPEDLATIVYTSGTTGKPKGVMLTHGNLASNIGHSLESQGFGKGDLCISFLPLSHITARHLDYVLFNCGATIAYCPSFDRVFEVAAELKPTVFVAVPRIYEKVYSEVQRRVGQGLKRALYNWALGTGRAHRDEVLRGQQPTGLGWKLADLLLLGKVRGAFGGRVRAFISGGAPLGRDLAEWYAATGIRIFEGYGLTETSPVVAINTPEHHRLGTVGRPLPNVECRIAEDGELLVRGPSIFREYWNLPEETRAAFTDGWFKTGDIGAIDADGFLSITDRKKDLIKTSGGKFIAPQPVENALKANPLVAQAAVIGDRRKFAMVVIAPNFALLEDWAQVNGVRAATREALVADAKVRTFYDGLIADVNQKQAQFATLKRVLLVADEFTVENGFLTPSLKLRRRLVEEKYRAQIDAIYEEPAPAQPVGAR